MRNNKLIIGVLGPTRNIRNIDPRGTITKLAQQVGQEITKKGQVILTGGESNSSIPSAIKSAAMEGARIAGSQSQPARLISVLRAGIFNLVYHSTPACSSLIINTALGDERNFINGYVPDAVIAIHGGAGTLSEITFANAVGTPIVFLQMDGIVDTLAALRQAPVNGSGNAASLTDILELTRKQFPFFDIDKVSEETLRLINGSPSNISDSPQSAVEMAMSAAHQRIMCSFNS